MAIIGNIHYFQTNPYEHVVSLGIRSQVSTPFTGSFTASACFSYAICTSRTRPCKSYNPVPKNIATVALSTSVIILKCV